MTNELAIRQILTVFLASPSDLIEERKVARKVVEKINRIVSHIGWHIDLRGWEDTLPNSGRPQAHINKDVESCDLFIGMLWERWGSSTGQYSSGFEEEFELAKKMVRNQVRIGMREREEGSIKAWQKKSNTERPCALQV